jgi:hypothetical protein
VKIFLDDPDQSKFPIGAQGTAAIYTSGEHGAWAALRKIPLVVELALSDQFLTSCEGPAMPTPLMASQSHERGNSWR